MRTPSILEKRNYCMRLAFSLASKSCKVSSHCNQGCPSAMCKARGNGPSMPRAQRTFLIHDYGHGFGHKFWFLTLFIVIKFQTHKILRDWVVQIWTWISSDFTVRYQSCTKFTKSANCFKDFAKDLVATVALILARFGIPTFCKKTNGNEGFRIF